MAKPTLYLMLGYPGAGKTTTAKIITDLTGAVHLASDQLRLELFPQPEFTQAEHEALYKMLDERTKTLLKQGRDVIYDANLNRYAHRQEKYAIAQTVGARPVLIWLKIDTALAKQRATADERNHLVPPNEASDKMFERIVGIFEPPKPDEPVIVLDGSTVNSTAVKRALKLT